ncbi:MAG: cellulase family glycosylhydrolase [Treponema sp.]|nr:cellulase family glycosylhydrolase [Treponema sp.]
MKKLFFLFLIVPFLWVSCPTEDSGLSVSLDKTSLTLTVGKAEKLTATVSPANTANRAVTWSSSDSGIAKVEGGGTVTAVTEGTATITVASRADSAKTAKCVVTVIPRPVTDIGEKDGLSGLTVAEYFEAKNVYIGWNLGNGFDASAGYGSWTQKINANFLPMIRERGFNMVRIPVTWNISTRPIGAAPDYQLNQDTLNELVEVVDWAYEAGLVTVINIHHDGSNPNGWLALNKLKANQASRDEITAKFVKVWEQIADKFKDYGDWLIFEPFNELHNGGWGWGTIEDIEFEIIDDLNQKFTDTVRAAGGKNAERFLVIQPLCAKPHQAMADTFTLPVDSIAGKQIVSMHYYDPEGFALRGNAGPDWGSEADRIRLSDDFQSFGDKFTKYNIPVILGECGATLQNRADPEQRALARANRLLYLDWMCGEAKRNKLVPVYWDNGTISASSIGENFGLFDRYSGEPLEGMDEVIDAMINAVQD